MKHIFVAAENPTAATTTLLLLHGTGGNEHDLMSIGAMLGKHFHRLGVRGEVSENGANRFFRRFGEGKFDVADLKKRSSDLVNFVKEAALQYAFALDKVVAVGYSNGANIAGGILLGHPDFLRGAVQWRPMIPYTPETAIVLPQTPVLITAGTHDPLADLAHVQQWATLLENYGANVSMKTLQTGHQLTQQDIDEAAAWCKAYA